MKYPILTVFVLLSLCISAFSQESDKPTPSAKKEEAASEENKYKAREERIDETDVSINYSFESLTNNRGDWQEARIDFVHRFTKRQVLYGTYRETDRFNLRDREARIGVYQPLSTRWTLNAEASASPTSRVLPRWSGALGVERSLGSGWIGKSGYRRTERENAKVNTTHFGVDKYWGKNLAAYSFSINNLEGTGTSPSQRIRYSRFYRKDSSLSVGFAFGEEVEQVGPDTILQSSIKNVSFHGTHRFNPSWSLNYGFGFHRQGQIYDRRRLTLGLRVDF